MTGSFNDPRILRIELPPGLPLLNANDRPAFRQHKSGEKQRFSSNTKKKHQIHSETFRQAKANPMTFSKVRIRVIFRGFDNHRRDVSNLFPTVKVMVDALVDAHIIPDDDDRHVKSMELIRGENLPKGTAGGVRGGGQLILQVIECD